MSSMSSQRVMALAGGLALALGLVMSGAALAALFTLSDSRAVGTVVQIERDAQGSVTGSVIRFADGDHREYTFSSAHTPSRLRDTVEVQFNARDPEGTARTSVDRLVWDPEGTVRTSVDRLVWAYTAAIGLTAAVLGGEPAAHAADATDKPPRQIAIGMLNDIRFGRPGKGNGEHEPWRQWRRVSRANGQG